MKQSEKLPIMKLSDKAAQDILYALPRVASISLFAPINVVQGIYAKHYGLALTTIASVVLFARLFDAITDPIIGYLSDKSRIKRGTRKPTIILGALVLACGGFFLYSPPDDVSVFYFVFWFMVFYLGYTLFEVPHMAWGGEISKDTQEKNQTYTLRAVSAYIGAAFFYSIPLLPIWETTGVTPGTLKFSAIVSGLLILPLLYLCMKRVPDGSCYNDKQPSIDKNGKPAKAPFRQFSKTVKDVIHNKPLLLFFSAFLFAGSALGMWLGLFFIYVDAYLGMGALFAKISLIGLLVSIPGAFVWLKVTNYLDKKYVWLLAMLLGIASFAYTGFLGPENVSYWTVQVLAITYTLCLICVDSVPYSMLSDIVDYSTWKFRTYRGATYFALFVFTYKAAFAVGVALALAITGWYGFDPSSTSQTESSITGLKMAMTWVPILLVMISMVFIALSPITDRRHGVIRRRLNLIEARSKKANRKPRALSRSATESLLMTQSAK